MRPVAEPEKNKRALLVVPDKGFGRNEQMQLATVKELIKDMPHVRESFDERQHRLGQQRVKYSAMLAHEEMAATVLAAGGTFKMAAAKAGISTRQVKKYYTAADFRARIEELRNTTFSKIRGRVLKELEKRTDPEKIGQIDLLDLLRVHDRVYGAPGGKPGVNIAGDVNVGGTHYDQLISALFTSQPGEESADFPIFELNGLSTSSDSPPE